MGRIREFFSTGGKYDFIKLALGSVAVLAVFSVSYLLWLAFFEDNPPAEIFSAIVEPSEVQGGDSVIYTLDWCKYTDAHAELRMTWKNDLLYLVPVQSPIYIAPGCRVVSLHTDVPVGLHPGEYVIGVEIIYNVNLFAERAIAFDMGPVIVTEPE